jgi:hypothetical protein
MSLRISNSIRVVIVTKPVLKKKSYVFILLYVYLYLPNNQLVLFLLCLYSTLKK